eukprot:TRINITY_DN3269_c0_g1_i1.p1 TRINITY_DN3269_c0_g1~~TRINITY_DN3269_c0_g1_i1.p1  ORF type:complete len:667 (-),score=142.87 TRINITY_DN3269_c0_g1_i1:62-1891(-)
MLSRQPTLKKEKEKIDFSIENEVTKHSKTESNSLSITENELDVKREEKIEGKTESQKEETEFISELSFEILLLIFSFLDIPSLSKASRVCVLWNQLINDDYIWKEKLFEKKDSFYSNQLFGREGNWRGLFRDLRSIKQNNSTRSIIEVGVEASSMDDASQDINQTLEQNEGSFERFWSSKGSSDPTSAEYLIYQLKQPLCIITSVSILPYQANYQQGCPIYAPTSMQVSVGFSPHKYHWKSSILPIENTRTMKKIDIAPYVTVGGFIRIDLFGRYQTQMQDDLYYTVLELVSAQGILIGELDSQSEVPLSMVRFAVKQDEDSFIKCVKDKTQSDDAQTDEELFETFVDFQRQQLSPYFKDEEIKWQEKRKLQDAFRAEDYDKAIDVAVNSERGHLRTKETIENLKAAGPLVYKKYLNFLFTHPGKLNKWETLDFCTGSLREDAQKYIATVALALVRNKFCITQELGDLMMNYDMTIALSIYQLLSIPDKIIECLIQLKCYKRLVAFCVACQYRFDYLELLRKLHQSSPFRAVKLALALREARGGPPVDMDNVLRILGITKGELEWDYRKILVQHLESLQEEESTPSLTSTLFSSINVEDDERLELDEEE